MYNDKEKCIGFIEYIPGEFAWRAVDAKGYLFIHCIWISPNIYKEKGYASKLIDECIKDAEKQGKYGVAVVASEGPFMAGKKLFLKNGFETIQSEKPSFELMVNKLKEGPLPKFKNWEENLEKINGLQILYSVQCPWVARSIPSLTKIAKENKLDLIVKEFDTAKEAQNAPSVYSAFNIVSNKKLIEDHYTSDTKFKNIIKKKIKN